MILVFGSINVDLAVPVAHLPAPGETVLGGDYTLSPGGKGANQALAARRAGAEVALAGAVGTDRFADIALAGLRAAGTNLDLVRTVAAPTGCAAIMVSATGENAIAVASGANALAQAGQVPDPALGAGTLLLLQMEVPAGENWRLVRRVRARGGSVILNLAPALPVDPTVFGEIDLVVANEGEAASLGAPPPDIAHRLRRGLAVTRGAAGATAFLADGSRLTVPAPSISPIDTTGAGDAFVGVLAAGLDRGLALADALRQASAAGSLTCLARGAQSAMPDSAAITAAASRLPDLASR